MSVAIVLQVASCGVTSSLRASSLLPSRCEVASACWQACLSCCRARHTSTRQLTACMLTSCGVQVKMEVPLIVRLEGTNVEKGKKILSDSDVEIITASDLDDAASKAVKSIS